MFNNLLNIRKHSSALARLIATVQLKEHGVECYFDQASEAINMRASRSEVLEALDKDISKTADVLFNGQSIINSIKDGRVREFDSIYNTVDDVFGLTFDRDENTITLSGVVFNISQATAYTKAQLKEMILKGIFGIERSELSGVLKTLVRYEETQDEYEKAILYPSTILADKIISKVVQQDMAFASVRRGMTHEEKSAFDTTFSRTGIDGVIQNSTFISAKGVEQLAPAHKMYDTKELDFLLTAGRLKYIEAVEIDGDGDVAKMEKLVKQIEQLKLNASFKFTLKARKLGNYSARGLFMQSQLIVAEDVRDTTAILHEIGHLIHLVDFSQDNFVNYLISKLTPMVTVPEELASKTAYYLEPTEVVARACEIAGLFAKEAGDETLSNDEGFALIKSRAFYEAFSGIYFDFHEFDETTKQELLALYELFYQSEKGTRPANIDNFVKIDTRFKRVEKEKSFHNFMNELKNKKERELRALYSLVNSEAIASIFENRKTALCDVLGMKILANITFCGNHAQRMTFEEWAIVTEDKATVVMFILDYLKRNLSPKEWILFIAQLNVNGAWGRVRNSVLLGGFSDVNASKIRKILVANEAQSFETLKALRNDIMMKNPATMIDADMIQDEEFVLKILDINAYNITAINAELVNLNTLAKWNRYVFGMDNEKFRSSLIHTALGDDFAFMDEYIALDKTVISKASESYKNDAARMNAYVEAHGDKTGLFFLGSELKDNIEFARPYVEADNTNLQYFTQKVKDELANAGEVNLVEIEIEKLKRADTTYRRKVARTTVEMEILMALAKDRNNDIRAEVAKRDITTAEMLSDLAKLKYSYIRAEVAKNANTPKAVLTKLLKEAKEDENHIVRAVVNNPKLSLKELEKVIKERKEYRYIKLSALCNPNILNFNHGGDLKTFRNVVEKCLENDEEFFFYEMRANSAFVPSKELLEDIVNNPLEYMPFDNGYKQVIVDFLQGLMGNAKASVAIEVVEEKEPEAKAENQDFDALIKDGQIIEFERTDGKGVELVLQIKTEITDFKSFNQWMKVNKKGYYSKFAKGFILDKAFAQEISKLAQTAATVAVSFYGADQLAAFASGSLF